MASLIPSRSLAVSCANRVKVHDHVCNIAQAVGGVTSRRAVVGRLQAASREPRSLHRLSPRSIPVSGPGSVGVSNASGAPEGQVTAALMNSMRAKICEALETDKCNVTDVYGDGRHVSIDVVSTLFEGKNSMQRQRMVYKAIWLELQEAVHAVDSMSTKTPEEASK